MVKGGNGCFREVELFPDTGGTALLHVYDDQKGKLILRGYFDAYQISKTCGVEKIEVASLPKEKEYLGAFDYDKTLRWMFIDKSSEIMKAFKKI